MNKNYYKIKLSLVIIFIYGTLFELVLPNNIFLSRPSILLESIVPLFADYSFFIHFSYTLTILLFGIILGYFLFILLSKLIERMVIRKNKFLQNSFLKYFPLFLILAGFFRLWNLYGITFEFLFAIFIITLFFSYNYKIFLEFIFPEQFADMVKNLNMDTPKVFHQIRIKSFLPTVVEEFKKFFIYYLVSIFIYEGIFNQSGIGFVFMHLLENKDLSGFLLLTLIIILVYLLLRYLFNNAFKRFIYWEGIDG